MHFDTWSEHPEGAAAWNSALQDLDDEAPEHRFFLRKPTSPLRVGRRMPAADGAPSHGTMIERESR